MESIHEADLSALTKDRTYRSSPEHWEEQIIYFLMADRFSDGREKGYRDAGGEEVTEGTGEPFSRDRDFEMILNDPEREKRWHAYSEIRNGGTLKGITGKLGYLKRLGITALWISPVFKQPEFEDSYHGYGIQNFLEVEPRLGTKDDLCSLVSTAHELGISVILDIVVNHSGNVFTYEDESVPWTGKEYPVRGFNSPSGSPDIPAVRRNHQQQYGLCTR